MELHELLRSAEIQTGGHIVRVLGSGADFKFEAPITKLKQKSRMINTYENKKTSKAKKLW